MKETLDAASRSELIMYRFNRAAETIEEAEYNTKGGYYNVLMLKSGFDASTHKGSNHPNTKGHIDNHLLIRPSGIVLYTSTK